MGLFAKFIHHSQIVPTRHNVYRIWLGVLRLAVKMQEDVGLTRRSFASLGGVFEEEVTRLEFTILRILNFNVLVKEETMMNIITRILPSRESCQDAPPERRELRNFLIRTVRTLMETVEAATTDRTWSSPSSSLCSRDADGHSAGAEPSDSTPESEYVIEYVDDSETASPDSPGPAEGEDMVDAREEGEPHIRHAVEVHVEVGQEAPRAGSAGTPLYTPFITPDTRPRYEEQREKELWR
mmetsp:Transcript_10284/g.21799  ORF Transcript_10284/g.21799 Transcript_10284/m.21799 type:complete len:239 (+) Transcript_10284:3-719(+)